MTIDHFEQKASDWDTRPVPLQISAAVGPLLRQRLGWNDAMRIMDFGAVTGLLASHVRRKLEAAGFEAVRFWTAVEVTREDGRAYPVFLVTARARAAP